MGGRPGRPRRLWAEVPPEESAIERMLTSKYRRVGDRYSLEERLRDPESYCPAAQPWPWTSRPDDPPEGWIPCRRKPHAGERFCYAHGGRSRAAIESEGARVAQRPDNTVDIEIRMPQLTLASLGRKLALIQRHAAAANAPGSAVVRFEDQLVRPRGDEETQVVHVTWSIEPEE